MMFERLTRAQRRISASHLFYAKYPKSYKNFSFYFWRRRDGAFLKDSIIHYTKRPLNIEMLKKIKGKTTFLCSCLHFISDLILMRESVIPLYLSIKSCTVLRQRH